MTLAIKTMDIYCPNKRDKKCEETDIKYIEYELNKPCEKTL